VMGIFSYLALCTRQAFFLSGSELRREKFKQNNMAVAPP